jgi:protein arginine kinase
MKLRGFLQCQLKKLISFSSEEDIVISSRVRLARNLNDKPFPWRASVSTLENILKDTSGFISGMKEFESGSSLFLGELDQTDKQLLVERHLISHDLMTGDLPRGVVFDNSEKMSVMINEEDHLRISAMEEGLNLREAAEQAVSLGRGISSKFNFAFSNDYGFLTTCPTNVGTAMRASVLVHTPALVMNNDIEPILVELSRAGMTIRGFYWEGTRVIGDIFQISNSSTLGREESEILDAVGQFARAVISRERGARKKLLMPGNRIDAEDKIYRAQAVLASARKIDFQEAMHLISRVKLGMDLGLEMRWKMESLDELIMLIQPAHIQELMEKELTSDERDIVRAKLIGQKLN